MGIDVMIVGPAESIASRPGDDLLEWLDGRFQDYEIRYGYICLEREDIESLRPFVSDPVGRMLINKVESLRTRDESTPYVIELMISA